jgi:hypothetical protein
MIIPKPYEVQAAAQIEYAGDRGKQEAFIRGVNWALQDAESIESTKCSQCGVPIDLHGTCCGWPNASVKLNENGIITDPRHPKFGYHWPVNF